MRCLRQSMKCEKKKNWKLEISRQGVGGSRCGTSHGRNVTGGRGQGTAAFLDEMANGGAAKQG